MFHAFLEMEQKQQENIQELHSLIEKKLLEQK
jgi:hypothetical protein